MPTVDERLASLEAKVETIADVRRFGDMDTRFTHMDARCTSIDERFTTVDGRFTSIDARFTELTGRISSLDAKVDRHFVWLMGMMFTGFISVIGALVGIVCT